MLGRKHHGHQDVDVFLLKDQCGLSGLRDGDKIAEGVRAGIVYAY